MKTRVLIIISILLGTGFVLAQTQKSKIWYHISVREVFISRQTAISYKDHYSAPEFGWHVEVGNSRLARGSLYSSFYVQVQKNEKIRMVLVERDLFQDDIVAGFYLNFSKKYTITDNGDFALIKQSQFFPDRKSGSDSNPHGANELSINKTIKDSVSFLGGDYTDFYKTTLPDTTVLMINSQGCKIDAPKLDHERIFPKKQSNSKFVILEMKLPGYVRIRGSVGSNIKHYSLYTITAAKRQQRILLRILNFIASNPAYQNSIYFNDFSKLMRQYDPDGTISYCRKSNKKWPVIHRIVCARFLYQNGSPDDIKKLNNNFAKEIQIYKDHVRSLRKKSINKILNENPATQ